MGLIDVVNAAQLGRMLLIQLHDDLLRTTAEGGRGADRGGQDDFSHVIDVTGLDYGAVYRAVFS